MLEFARASKSSSVAASKSRPASASKAGVSTYRLGEGEEDKE